jgi:hypothetical protein
MNRIFKPVEVIIRRGQRSKEKNGGDESIHVIIHIIHGNVTRKLLL